MYLHFTKIRSKNTSEIATIGAVSDFNLDRYVIAAVFGLKRIRSWKSTKKVKQLFC